MMHFLFTECQRVKVKDTGQIGTVVYRGAVGPADILFYSIVFDDGKRKEFAEDELLPVIGVHSNIRSHLKQCN